MSLCAWLGLTSDRRASRAHRGVRTLLLDPSPSGRRLGFVSSRPSARRVFLGKEAI